MFLIAVSLVISALAWMMVRNSETDRKYPPGPWELPILGSLLRIDPEKPHYSLKEIADKYGKSGLCRIHLGSVETVMINDPRLVREAFASEKFSGRAPLFLTHGIMKGNGIICAEGEMWRDQRKLLVTWLRNLGAAKNSQKRPVMEIRIMNEVEKLIEKLKTRNNKDESIDLAPLLSNSMGLTIMSIVYGVSFEEDDPTWKWLQHIQEEGAKAMGVLGIVNFLPFLRFFSKSIRNTMNTLIFGQMQTHTINRCCIEIRRVIKKLKSENKSLSYEKILSYNSYNSGIKCIDYGLKEKETQRVHVFKPTDLIISEEECMADYYIDEQNARISKDKDSQAARRLNETQLVFFLADLFGAGLDTTLFSVSWFLLFMGLYPDIQEKVRQEIKSMCGEREPCLDDMQYLVYTRAAISESQRLRPTVPLGVPHGCMEDTTLGDYFIKKGTMIIASQWAFHTDSKAWDDPLTYNPSRFISDNDELLSPQHFIPFQTGKRMCPGDDLARCMMYLYSTNILANFKLTLDGTPSNLEGDLGITLQTPSYKLFMQPLKE